MKKVIIFSGITIAIIIFLFYYGAFSLTADYNSIYTKDFSKNKLSLIKVGMSKQQVKSIMGEPFTEDGCFRYSKAKQGINTIPPFAGDIWWHDVVVCYDFEGTVMSAAINTFYN